MTDAFAGQWARRGMIHRPVIGPEPTKTLCEVCGGVAPSGLCRPCRDSARVRVHGSHAGFAQHQRRNEMVCQDCSDAEKVYQGARYRPGSLSKADREWCEKNSVRHSWELACRYARLTNNLPEEPPMSVYRCPRCNTTEPPTVVLAGGFRFNACQKCGEYTEAPDDE